MKSKIFLKAFICTLACMASSCLPAFSQSTGAGTAVSLNGTTNAYLQLPSGTWFSGNFTVEAWVYMNSYNNWSRLFDFSDGPDNYNVYLALTDGTAGYPMMGVFTNNDPLPTFSANTQLPLNQWVHVAATGNGTNGTIYLNGNPVGTGMLNVAPNILRTNNYIGHDPYAGDAYANAVFDDLRIWNMARTRVQIQTEMNHSPVGNEAGLVGYWRFDEGNGTDAYDSTGNSNTATLNSGVTWTNSTAPLTNAADYALKFSGSQVVTIPRLAAQDSYPLTAMCWFMDPTNSPGAGALVGNYSSSSFNGWHIAITGGQLYGWYYVNSITNVTLTGAGVVNDGLWHNVAFVVSSAGGVIYLDGVPKQTNAWVGTAGACTTTQPIYLGIYQGDSLYTGDIDEVSVWNVALTQSQIQTYMHQPLQGTESGLVNYYRMNEGVGTNIYDYSTNADTGPFSTPFPAWILSGAQMQEAPEVVTLSATTNSSSETLNGTLNPQGLNSGSWFRYGLTTGYGNVTATNTFAASYTVSTNAITLSGLAPGIYHFQIVATNSSGVNYGVDQTFTAVVPPVPPQVATLPATVNGTSATLRGTVNPEYQNTAAWFNWGSDTNYGNATSINTFAAGGNVFTNTAALSGLSPGVYHFQIVATNASGTNFGADENFAITGPPQLATLSATLNGASPTLNGTVNPEGLKSGSWFNWGLTTSYGNVTPANIFAAGYTSSASASMLGSLAAGTYHFQIAATNALGTNYGVDQSFTIVTLFQLGNTNVVEGAASGEDSVVLGANPSNASWSATANASWLHLVTSSSGIGSLNVIFSFDTNSGATRTGTLTIAGQQLTVTQAGSTYVQAGALTSLAGFSSAGPAGGITVDGAGNVYYTDNFGNLLGWFPASDTVATIIPSYYPNFDPVDVAADSAGNLYVVSVNTPTLDKWTAANSNVTTLTYFSQPTSVAVDRSGNVYVTDQEKQPGQFSRVGEWVAANNSEVDLTENSVAYFFGVAVDAANNVYFSDFNYNIIYERIAASGSIVTLTNEFYSPFDPEGLAVDGGGNLYIANAPSSGGTGFTITRLSAITHNQTTVVPPTETYISQHLAVDSARNLYIANGAHGGTMQELPYAFVDPTAKSYPATAGSDSLPAVVPANINLNTPFAPTSNQPWLTITGTANGVVSYSFTANTSTTPRAAQIQLLGQSIDINQAGAPPVPVELGTTNLLVSGVGAGESDIVVADPAAGTWTVSANATWLHTMAGYQSGIGSTNVIFSFDSNPGAARTGTFTIGNQTLTVSQAPTNYVAVSGSPATVLNNLALPWAMAFDGAGNAYIADFGFGSIFAWNRTNNTVVTLDQNAGEPQGVAVDSKGNVYFSDAGSASVEEWNAANSNVTKLVSGVVNPYGVAVDSAGNVYFADYSDVKEWIATNGDIVTLVSGLNAASGVAVDIAGNVYIADTDNNELKEWSPATGDVTILASSTNGLVGPFNLAVDGSGNVFSADAGDFTIQEWSAANGTVTVPASDYEAWGVAVDASDNIYVPDTDGTIKELQNAFVDPTPKSEPFSAGNDSLPAVFPINTILTGPFAPTSDSPWVTITGVSNGVVSFSFAANNTVAVRTANINLAGQLIAVNQAAPPPVELGTTNLLVAGAGGKGSDIVVALDPAAGSWTVTANAAWLHTLAGYQSSIGSTNMIFTVDSNPGAARTGTFTIDGQTLTVTQAPTNYLAVSNGVPATIVSGLGIPEAVALDGAGNFYVADDGQFPAIREWVQTNNTVITLVSNLSIPLGVAVDNNGNVYFSDAGSNTVNEWTAASSNVTTLVSSNSGINTPERIAVDSSANVYIANYGTGGIKEWIATNGNVVPLIPIGFPIGVAVDVAGNVYSDNFSSSTIYEWFGPAATNFIALTGRSQGIYRPRSLAVDGSGNLFIADYFGIHDWTAASGQVSMASSQGYFGVAVDSSDNLYVTMNDGTIRELQRAFVIPTAKSEPFTAGNDSLPPPWPANVLLTGPFAPTSDSPWVTITGVNNGVVSFSFTANTTGAPRTANINLAGQLFPVSQGCIAISTTNLLEGPTAGADSVTLQFSPPQLIPWTASANAPWLHVVAGNLPATGITNFVFTFDANPGPTRTGALTLNTTPLFITQAGVTYVAAPGPLTALVTNGVLAPANVAVDNTGYVYITDPGNQSFDEWVLASNSLETNVIGGLGQPNGVAVNNADGTVVFSDTTSNIVYGWAQGYGNSAYFAVSSGLNGPCGVAIDSSDNIYIADSGNNAVEENDAHGYFRTLVSGLNNPQGVAVDAFGDVYVADTGNNAIKEWFVANSNVVTVVSNGLSHPAGVAVDVSGNIFIADTGDSAIKEWVAASGTLTTLVGTGLNRPGGVALDSADDLYIADTGDNAVDELPRTFVDPTSRLEPYLAGSDSLPVILPASINLLPPFAPTSSQSWLTVTNTAGGIVNFAFAANAGPVRTAYLSVLGESIAVTQTNSLVTPPRLTGAQLLGNGAFQFTFTNAPGFTFTVLATTNLALPLTNWVNLGTVTNASPGIYQYTTQPMTNSQEFYEVVWP